MGQVAKNAFKGYVYQQYIFTLFFAKMDTERQIVKLENEATDTKKFDDLYITARDENFRIQIKNYKNAKLEDISITDHFFSICGNQNEYDPNEKNVVIVNTDLIETNSKFMGLDAVVLDNITIIPLVPERVEDLLDDMFSKESREVQIINMGYRFTCDSKFVITQDDLPELIRISTDLENKTIIIREPLSEIKRGITHIVGKPGVGKSHYVNELISKFGEAILYRFWVSSQDRFLRDRLDFDNFVDDIGYAVFKSSKKFKIDELVAKINEEQIILIIDGLDHIENYNPLDLDRFIDFINMINKARVVVLSRPLKKELEWDKIELDNWDYDKTSLYLSSAYDIYDYKILHNIFKITNGYPIITYFIAEQYLLSGEIDLNRQLDTIDEYYETLIKSLETRTALTIFATNNSFFLKKELEELLDNNIAYSMLNEFIKSHPYLFMQNMNRISLIHDSFNTYLRKQIKEYPSTRQQICKKVEESIMSGNIEYMHRMLSFDFEKDFYNDLLIKYCDFEEFEKLLSSTVDYNSIVSFYNQIKDILEKRPNVLDVYQYYAFVLIFQAVTRNDMQGDEGLIYQILIYLKRHFCIEDCIFSSGTMWNLYMLLEDKDETKYNMYLSGELSTLDNCYAIFQKTEEEERFFKKDLIRVDFHKVEAYLKNETINQLERRNIITRFLVSTWIFQEKNEWYDALKLYIEGNDLKAIAELKKLIAPYDIDDRWTNGILPNTRYQLQELGFFEEDNMFNGISLKEFIKKYACEGSFEVAEYVKSFLRKVNKEELDTDINSVNYFFVMYAMRKDYSVNNIDKALCLFEDYDLICEDDSIEIIKRLMRQSEKGIRHLLREYINNKPLEFTKKLISVDFFKTNDQVDVFELTSDRIDLFSEEEIIANIFDKIKYLFRVKNIPFRDIENVMHSKYCELLLDLLQYYKFSVYDGLDDDILKRKFEEFDIEYIVSTVEEKEYVPLEYGCIHRSDRQYIIDSQMSYIEMSRYVDGWYSCLPYVDLYEIYDKDEIKNEYLNILHNSIFAKKQDSNYTGVWYLLIGNILEFVKTYGNGIDFKKLFSIFKKFLDVSLIYSGKK